jgi:hypothetical protein
MHAGYFETLSDMKIQDDHIVEEPEQGSGALLG